MIDEQEVDCYIAQQLHTLRQTMGITQAQLADEIGVSTQQVQKYERAINRLSASKLMQCAEAFEVSVLVFYPERENHPLFSPVPPPMVRFIRLLGRVSPAHHGELYTVLRALVKLSTGESIEGE
jgi:transcriptional regulator with XRE-family HTH domain